MTRHCLLRPAAALAACLVLATALPAQEEVSADPALRVSTNFRFQFRPAFRFAFNFRPDRILRGISGVEVSSRQRERIAEQVVATEHEFAPLRLELSRLEAEFERVLASPTLDSIDVLIALDRVLEVEHRMKRLQVSLLLRTRESLTPAQRRAVSEAAGRNDHD